MRFIKQIGKSHASVWILKHLIEVVQYDILIVWQSYFFPFECLDLWDVNLLNSMHGVIIPFCHVAKLLPRHIVMHLGNIQSN